jgi:glutamyl-tRNA reductase
MSQSHGCPHQGVCSTVPAQHFRAVADLSGLQALRALTFNHANLGIVGLAHVALAPDALAALNQSLAQADIEAFTLTTCNRTEIYWRACVPGDDERVREQVGAQLDEIGAALARDTHVLRGRAAARHLFRVCCGIESLALGEAEILGQARAALEGTNAISPFLRGVVVSALRTGRMARAETRIGVGALSVASAAVQLVAAAMPLDRSRVLIVGAGATGVKVSRHLLALGSGDLVLANRTIERAATLAETLGAGAIGLDAVHDELTRAAAVVCAVAAPEPLIRRDALEAAMAARGGRPLLVVDLSMPPVVEPGMVAGVTRVDLAAIEQQVARQRESRSSEIPGVEAIVERELLHLDAWARRHALRPLVSDLRRKVEIIRLEELQRASRELAAAGDADLAVLDRLSRRLLDQVLAIPLSTLETGELPLDPAQAHYLRRLFALDPGGGA